MDICNNNTNIAVLFLFFLNPYFFIQMTNVSRFLYLQRSFYGYRLHFYWVVALMFLSIFLPNWAKADCVGVSIADSLNLVALYNNTNGNAWNNNSNWLTQPVRDWYGVALTNDGCYVREITLQGNNLTGNLPQFTAFSQVEKFILSDNNLNGSLPAFNSLIHLQELYLALNDLTGSSPSFNDNPELKRVDISYNQLTGSLPLFANNNMLEIIDFSGNQITGSIPAYSNLTQLTRLKLAYNNLSGTLPNFDTLTDLTEFNAGDNQLSGGIPNYNLPNLAVLGLYVNNFTGTLPVFENLVSLQEISVLSNDLSGTLPDFANSLSLKTVDAGRNQFSGNIPAGYAELPNLRYVNLTNNDLSGMIPDFANPLLDSLIVDSNSLWGIIPNFVLPNLKTLKLCAGNNFWGSVPNFAGCPMLNASALDFSCVTAARISGKIYDDENGDCQYNLGEPTLPHVLVTLNGSEQYVFSDENGNYELLTDASEGDTVQVFLPSSGIWAMSACGSDWVVVPVPASDSQISGINFGLTATELCPQLLVEISTPKIRICSENIYTINYCNQGATVATAAYLEFLLPDSVTVLSADLPYSIAGNGSNNYVFDLGDVNIGQCGAIHITTSVACGVLLGSTLCAEVFAYPNGYCGTVSELWDGSRLVVEGECAGTEVLFKVKNVGLGMADSVVYRIYEDDVINVLSKIKLNAGAEISFSRPANGSTYRLVAAQTPYNPIGEYVQSVVELCGVQPLSLGFVISQSAQDLQPDYESDCHEAVGSYDPNDKTAVPKGIDDSHHYLPPNEEITYTIRFQNTGTDTAYRVVLIDTLSSQTLRPETVNVTAASHPYHLRIDNGRVLIVSFESIMLPDSSTNRQGSEGFISFKIQQKRNNSDNTLIENFADIYFDHNDPIRTATVFHTILNIYSGDGNSYPPTETNVKVMPNPANTHIIFDASTLKTESQILLYDVLGRNVAAVETQSRWATIDVSHLSVGIYFYQINTPEKNKLQQGKIIVVR